MFYRNGFGYYQNKNDNDPTALRNDKNVNIEISYDNFDTINLDFIRKKQYAQDLLGQIEENKRKKREALEKKKLEDLEEELRLKREQELIELRQNEENKRFNPKINLSVQEPLKNQRKRTPNVNVNYITTEINTIENNNNNNYFSENYLRARGKEIDIYNDKILENLKLLNNDFEYNINSLKSEIGLLNNMNAKNKRYKDKLYQEVHYIKENLDDKKIQDSIDSKNIYDVVSDSEYTKFLLSNLHSYKTIPNRRYEIKPYISREPQSENRFFIDDEKKGDGLKLSPYVNLSHVISYDTPRWKWNNEDWLNY